MVPDLGKRGLEVRNFAYQTALFILSKSQTVRIYPATRVAVALSSAAIAAFSSAILGNPKRRNGIPQSMCKMCFGLGIPEPFSFCCGRDFLRHAQDIAPETGPQAAQAVACKPSDSLLRSHNLGCRLLCNRSTKVQRISTSPTGPRIWKVQDEAADEALLQLDGVWWSPRGTKAWLLERLEESPTLSTHASIDCLICLGSLHSGKHALLHM